MNDRPFANDSTETLRWMLDCLDIPAGDAAAICVELGLRTERPTPPRCPACEAAARERDDLHSLCDRQADILSRVAVALRGPEPPQTKWSHHDLPERAAAVIHGWEELESQYTASRKHNEKLADENHRLAVIEQERDDLRARLAGLIAHYERYRGEKDERQALAFLDMLDELAPLLRKEAK